VIVSDGGRGRGQPYDPSQRPAGERLALLSRVPRGAVVLDVGCWSGFMGSHLIMEREAIVDGVEPNQQMADRARHKYRNVRQSTIEDACDQISSAYDVVLFMDVLEHLADPALVLHAALGWVAPGGRALVSIPNVAHWSVRWHLLRGRWTYTEYGLLDRTHLRFFTINSAEALAWDAGWRVVWRSYSLGDPPKLRLSASRRRHLGRWPELFAVQTLMEIVPR
jgi:2-polyprenyl-3-methyl-5-hydroxy-6-metoxy-1,4-benzoquinol methylase